MKNGTNSLKDRNKQNVSQDRYYTFDETRYKYFRFDASQKHVQQFNIFESTNSLITPYQKWYCENVVISIRIPLLNPVYIFPSALYNSR